MNESLASILAKLMADPDTEFVCPTTRTSTPDPERHAQFTVAGSVPLTSEEYDALRTLIHQVSPVSGSAL